MEFHSKTTKNLMTTLSVIYKKAYCKKAVKITASFRRLDVEKINSKA